MKTKHLIQKAKGCERLTVTEKNGVTYIAETKRGGVGIVVWKDNTIQRTDIPFTGQYANGMRVYEAEMLLGLRPKPTKQDLLRLIEKILHDTNCDDKENSTAPSQFIVDECKAAIKALRG